MATGITTYQCPACTGPLHFAGESGKLECDYCGKSYEVAEIEKLFSEKEAASVAAQAKADAAGEGKMLRPWNREWPGMHRSPQG